MALAPRLTLQLLAALAVPAAGAAYVGSHLFAVDAASRGGSWLLVPAALIGPAAAVLLVSAALMWLVLAPVRAGLAPGAGDATRRAAAVAALRAPARIAGLTLLVASAGIAGVAAQRLLAGGATDVAAAASSAAAAFAIMAGMIAYSVTSAGLAQAIIELGPSDPPVRNTIRGEVLLVSTGLIAFALLLAGPLAYARYRADMDHHHVAHAEQALDSAARLVPSRGPGQAVELVFLATGASSALLGPGGGIVARAGDADPALLRVPAGPAVEIVPGGWRLRHPLPGGQILVAFVPEAPLLERRRAFWATNTALGLGLLAAASLLVWLVARGLGAPVRFLASAAERVASGDLRVYPPTVNLDEIGQLAADFRRMVDGLTALVQGVQGANQGVLAGAREMEVIGNRVRAGAVEEREQVFGVQGAVEAMQESVAQAGRGVAGLSEYVGSTGQAVARMAAALEEVRRQAAELVHLAESSTRDAESLSGTGRRAEGELRALQALANHAGGSLSGVSGSLESLESSAVASQLAAAQAAEFAEHAGGVVREAADGIEGVRLAVADAKRRVTVLGRRSDDIDQILTFINEVAGRTNLLSLNASIIATQAGEHGKAFAVVAEQIRALAAQISRSTESIGEIIRAVRDDVEGTARLIDRGDDLAAGGVALARKSLGALDEIRNATAKGHETAAAIQVTVQAHGDTTREVANLVASVAANSRALLETVDMVGKSVVGVGSVTRGVNGLADQVSRALEDQTALGRRQLEALGRINGMLSDIARAMERHGAETRRVQESLRRLTGTAQQHEAAVGSLSGVAGRIGAHARALAERVDRFKVRS